MPSLGVLRQCRADMVEDQEVVMGVGVPAAAATVAKGEGAMEEEVAHPLTEAVSLGATGVVQAAAAMAVTAEVAAMAAAVEAAATAVTVEAAAATAAVEVAAASEETVVEEVASAATAAEVEALVTAVEATVAVASAAAAPEVAAVTVEAEADSAWKTKSNPTTRYTSQASPPTCQKTTSDSSLGPSV